MGLVGFAVPEDEVVRLVELDATRGRQREQVGVAHRAERRIGLQKIDDSIADSSGIHDSPRMATGMILRDRSRRGANSDAHCFATRGTCLGFALA